MLAEVHRQLHGTRFTTPMERLAVADHTTALALERADVSQKEGARRIL